MRRMKKRRRRKKTREGKGGGEKEDEEEEEKTEEEKEEGEEGDCNNEVLQGHNSQKTGFTKTILRAVLCSVPNEGGAIK